MMTLLCVEKHIWTCACVTKSASRVSCSWWQLCCVEKHIWTCACVTKSTSSASCSWWRLSYMSKSTYGHVLALPSQHLVRPVADDNFVYSVHWGINPPSKTPAFLPSSHLNRQTVQAPPPFLGNPAPSISVFHEPPPPSPKSQIFWWTPKILEFFILNTILSFKSN